MLANARKDHSSPLKLADYLVCARNSELHNQEFLEHINSHCRRTSKITSRKYLKKGFK